MCQVEDACIICATFPTTWLHFPVCICWSSLFMANCSLSYWSARLFPCLLLFPMLHFLILITTCLNPKPTFPTKARLVEILTIFLTLIAINPLLPPTLSHPSPHICSRDMLHPSLNAPWKASVHIAEETGLEKGPHHGAIIKTALVLHHHEISISHSGYRDLTLRIGLLQRTRGDWFTFEKKLLSSHHLMPTLSSRAHMKRLMKEPGNLDLFSSLVMN